VVNSSANVASNTETFNLLGVWRTLRKRKFLSMGVAVTVFAGVAIYTYLQTPIYESEALILIDNRKEIPVNERVDKEMSNAQTLDTEIQILRSKSLVGKAIGMLQPPLNSTPPEVVAGNLSLTQLGEAGVLRIALRDTLPARAKAILTALGDVYVQYSLDSKRSQATNAIKFIEQKLPQAKRELDEASAAVRDFRRTNNIPDPDAYATTMAGTQVNLQQRIRDLESSIAQNQRQFDDLRTQLGEDPDIALALVALSDDPTYISLINDYKKVESEYNIKRSQGQTEKLSTVQQLRDKRDALLRQLVEQSNIVLGKERAAKVRRLKGPVVPILSSSPIAPGAAATEGAPGGATAGEAPIRQGIQKSLAQKMIDLRLTLSAQREQLASLRRQQSETTEVFKKIPRLQQDFTEMQRRLALSSQTYNNLLTKLEELRISEAHETSSWKVLEPPYLPTEPIAPKRNQNLLYGLIAGLFLGLGAAFVPDLLDERLRGVEEAKELTGLPLLGAIPKTDELVESVVVSGRDGLTIGERAFNRQYTRSPFKEALRSLALSLRYLGSSNSVKTLLFTSSIPAEGKSVITFNLGLVLSEFGRRVLVVDADMRKSSLHRYLELPNSRGLSTAIATETPWKQLIQTGSNPNLHLMTSGPMPPNPVALLNSERMEELLAEWREEYDYVLIDTPPIVGLPDAQSLINRVDRVVLVAGIERTTRSVLNRVIEILRGSSAEVAGIVVNLLNDDNDGYYYSYYTSYYSANSEEGEAAGSNGRPASRRSRGGLLGLFRR